ncbi:Glycine receptor subunit alphaZ1 [Chionoecetes opilio]|uniref:Glycine receptor subunit alphaZ1 n=1 Tax=Chionoecetes opilio TaxID=41210 RepID=A0A8J4XSF4_CHIOP|nr:Glycine receptor subunit alphaZ1 [Chionoecetes opilio]
MDFADYPFDEQVCGTVISSCEYGGAPAQYPPLPCLALRYSVLVEGLLEHLVVLGVLGGIDANTDDVIMYEWEKNKDIDMPDGLEIAQFNLLKLPRTEGDMQVYVTGNFSSLKVGFDLRRQNGYHVLQTYIPTILIVVISWVSFWLGPNMVPGRVSLGVTTLLTLTTLASGIRAQLPPVSYVKAIDVWIGMCMIMVFGALLEFTFVNWLANKKMIGDPSIVFRIPLAVSPQE